ncbi:MAG: chloride channel protein [Planctomycetes bacterium]|nr:chloride channel protein [Planctomycetota bacterium]
MPRPPSLRHTARDALLALLLGALLAPFAHLLDLAIAAVAALAGLLPTALSSHPNPTNPANTIPLPWALPLTAACGALLSAFALARLAPECAGAGTDSALAAFHQHQGRLRRRVPFAKLCASALVVGSGGSGGRQGPIVQIGGAVGAWLAEALHLDAERRRALLVFGVAAGVGAAFRAPLGGGVFAAEFLCRGLGVVPHYLLPACLASASGALVAGAMAGSLGPVLPMPEVGPLAGPEAWLSALLLALFLAPWARGYVAAVQWVNRVSRRVPGPRPWATALGGLAAGTVALLAGVLAGDGRWFGVAGQSVGLLQQVLAGGFAGWGGVGLLVGVALAKLLATALTIGTGGSAGLFAPSLLLGAAAGGAGALAVGLWGGELSVAQGSLLGMAGVFAGAGRVPLATAVLVVELTGLRTLALPCLVVALVVYWGAGGGRRPGLFVHQPERLAGLSVADLPVRG